MTKTLEGQAARERGRTRAIGRGGRAMLCAVTGAAGGR